MKQEVKDRALPAALFLYHQIKPLKNDLLYFQDGFTGYKIIPTVCLYLIINIICFLISQLHLPPYSFLSLLVCMLMIPGDVYLFMFHTFCYSFKRTPGYVPKPYLNSSLALPELCARLGVLYSVSLFLLGYIFNSLHSFSFVNVSVITFVIGALFYISYWLGDVLVSFLIVHVLFFMPLIITRKIGFSFFYYPDDLEIEILEQIKPVIEEDQRNIEQALENQRRSHEGEETARPTAA